MKKTHLILSLLFLFVAGCKKDINDQKETPESLDPLISQARKTYEINYFNKERTSSDTIDLFYALNLQWEAARISFSSDSTPFVVVPLDFEGNDVGLTGDMIFYTGQNNSIQKEIWFQPFQNSYIDQKHEDVINGVVVVINEEYNTSQYFVVNNHVCAYVDSLSHLTDGQQLVAGVDDRWPGNPIRCPQWGDGFWEDVGDFFGDVWNNISQWVNSNFGGNGTGGSGGIPGGVTSGGGTHSGGGSTGGGYSGGWSGTGSWYQSYGGVTGGGVIQHDLDAHVIAKAHARLLHTYGLDMDEQTMLALFGIDCIESLGSAQLPAGNYYLESECIEAVLDANPNICTFSQVNSFIEEYNSNINVTLEIAERCAMDYPGCQNMGFEPCLKEEVTNYYLDLVGINIGSLEDPSEVQNIVLNAVSNCFLCNTTELRERIIVALNQDGLDEVLIEEEEQGDPPAVSTNRLMCPQLFNFQFTCWPQTPNCIIRSAGISQFRVTFPVNGQNLVINIRALYFQGNLLSPCDESMDKKASDAINAAVTNTIQRINNSNLYTEPNLPFSEQIKGTFLIELTNQFDAERNACVPQGRDSGNVVKFLSLAEQLTYSDLNGTQFTPFNPNFDIYCP